MDRLFFIAGSLLGLVAVSLGAVGTHMLKAHMSLDELRIFEVGVRYQMYHALALFAVAWGYSKWPSTSLKTSGWLLIAGAVLFSGSLYAYSLSKIAWLVFITPIGGIILISGWLIMAWSIWKR